MPTMYLYTAKPNKIMLALYNYTWYSCSFPENRGVWIKEKMLKKHQYKLLYLLVPHIFSLSVIVKIMFQSLDFQCCIISFSTSGIDVFSPLELVTENQDWIKLKWWIDSAILLVANIGTTLTMHRCPLGDIFRIESMMDVRNFFLD